MIGNKKQRRLGCSSPNRLSLSPDPLAV